MSGYFVENFGCRATQADGAALERQFEERGMARASTPAQATVVVMNTCTVTAGADQDARAAIRRVRRQNPEAESWSQAATPSAPLKRSRRCPA